EDGARRCARGGCIERGHAIGARAYGGLAPRTAAGPKLHRHVTPWRMVMIRISRLTYTILAAAVAVALPVLGLAQPKPLRPYTLILDFVPTGEYVPHYTALEKGFYRDEGLDVKIVRGQGSGDTVKRIAAGQGDVGIADVSALIAARAHTDGKVKALPPWYRQAPPPL